MNFKHTTEFFKKSGGTQMSEKLEKLLKDFATYNNTYRFYKVGVYTDKEGTGDLYYDIIKDDFYKEKDYQYLVEFDAPVKETLHRLFFYERFYPKDE